ncbi:hypothetical protein MPLA_250042 [Mesorhizobium sp. ORS 3359]|nr:hypothetical protein MPLA_250042 [Mesorhizobium sp. ORS 3359]
MASWLRGGKVSGETPCLMEIYIAVIDELDKPV